jgi:hypothetical protein
MPIPLGVPPSNRSGKKSDCSSNSGRFPVPPCLNGVISFSLNRSPMTRLSVPEGHRGSYDPERAIGQFRPSERGWDKLLPSGPLRPGNCRIIRIHYGQKLIGNRRYFKLFRPMGTRRQIGNPDMKSACISYACRFLLTFSRKVE